MTEPINSAEVSLLVTKVEEAARATEEGVKHFIEPAPGTLKRAVSKRHHIVFGRRGSGKSSLLRKAAADLTVDRRPIAYVNLEAFKGHSYPDVLLSVLIATFREFKKWLDTAAVNRPDKVSFWQKLFGTVPSRPSFNRKESARLSGFLQTQIAELGSQLHTPDEAEVKVTTSERAEAENTAELSAGVKSPVAQAGVTTKSRGTSQRGEEVQQDFKQHKSDFLHRHIMDYQQIFREMATLSQGDSYLVLDDLYHIRRADQAKVIDYFHRIAKDHHLWLKVGTIKHRTEWYFHGDPPIGVKLGDDADEIDLDITLEKYELAKQFLSRVLMNFAAEAGLTDLSELLTGGAAAPGAGFWRSPGQPQRGTFSPEPGCGSAAWLCRAQDNRYGLPRGRLRAAQNSPARVHPHSTLPKPSATSPPRHAANARVGAYMNVLALRRAHSAKDVPRLAVMRSNQGETGCG